jgi:glucose-6-phosphate 1-dehydrogenase
VGKNSLDDAQSGTARTLVLFGASGDLARRMLLPSLYSLHREGLLDDQFRIIASARGPMDGDGFKGAAAEALKQFLPADQIDGSDLETFLKRLHFVAVDITDQSSFNAIAQKLDELGGGDPAIFLSTSPALYPNAIAGLKAAGLTGRKSRIALEKPIGHDLASSRAINDAVKSVFDEDQTYRIDHYLGKETVQNLLALRFANVLFEPLWNNDHIDHIQISGAETVGLEGRTGFYDDTGALRDMVQNHLLQLVSLIAMEPPTSFDAASVRNEKVKVLRALRPIGRDEVATHSAIGQYAAGTIGGAPVPGYRDELGGPSDTETFVALKMHIDNWRWKGVPFYLRTGKRLPARRSEILIQFKSVPHSIFGGPKAGHGNGLAPNKLLIRLQPNESIRLLVMVKEPGLDHASISLREVSLDLSLADAFTAGRPRISYERLLLDFLNGDPTLFVRRDEVEAQWDWIDAVRDGWAHHGMTPEPYASGEWGPASANALTEQDGVHWHD